MKLYLMQIATFAGSGAPIPAYLVQTDDGTNVLIDTAITPEAASAYGAQMDEKGDVVSQLGHIGVAPADVRYLVCTHFDGDHAGRNAEFPQAEHVVQRSHLEAARNGLGRAQPLRGQWGAAGLRYREVDGDVELLPGIELIETSGHVPGHQAVLVRLPETGPVVLAIDAIPSAELLDPDERLITEYDMEEAGVRASTRKLVDLAAREGAAMLIHGHDAAQWQTLRKLPEYYG
ncbi:MAG TPA: N-acyl homoserine lactonase family protein [Candidatus Dormibacteraeota bacterium]|nr:N-acyl homoserine lactonase family protein [Candidatus Dormibacteraeota bacterium]